ncbi:nicastrin isoform X2 [Neodiprion pinetum]|uniref:Nicastrin n=1 Tax=Neodiprion lecontei TaxID=441921 RepID=A0ABM3G3D2_NEOLC|nr:nicastrin isoform X2 [Neodiprion fabricii]XP_046480130.1 nicastrin isoform X2 [Neodiprion pinetum]XP_046594774.1 nicastrin isoform X2 [Neodiprion lecontei]XP_046617556.1 nicastrin isoform X2 [Neodiprion virginianus]
MAAPISRGCILLFILINAACTERIKDMIYKPLEGVAACFRRHNGTNQFGCSSSRSGSVGVIHIIEDEAELVWLEKNGNAGPYTAVVPFSMFTRDTLIRLRNTENINGILLTYNSSIERPSHYSPDDTCPNRYAGFKQCDTEKPWNPWGSALLMEDWPFPMFYLKNQSQLNDVKTCFTTFNAHDRDSQSQRSLCALEMKSFMFSAVDSETCIRRSIPRLNFNPPLYCDPLGDRNIYWPLAALDNQTESVILVTARLDASTLFDTLAPGANSAITGLVTLIATAHYLHNMNPTVGKTNVVFSLFNGEAFDYIGSSRFVFDLKNGSFHSLGEKTLMFDQIRTVVELGQLGEGDIYLHSSNYENDSLITALIPKLSAKVLKDSVPPASIQSFLAESSTISATVIASHGVNFTNKYYHSILDDAESVNFTSSESGLAKSLDKIALELANQLFIIVTGTNTSSNGSGNIENLISKMLSCYLESANCSLFKSASAPGHQLPDQVLPLYVGVNRSLNYVTTYTGQLLALLTGTTLAEYNSSMCYENQSLWMAGLNFQGTCIRSAVNYSFATSPAFLIDGYDMKSGYYSTWTESVWQVLSMKMFLKPSVAAERLNVILGSLVAIASFIIVWFIQFRADLLFNQISYDGVRTL